MAKNQVESSKSTMFEKFMPILLVVSIGLAFMVGVLWQKVSNLEKGGVTTTGTQQAAQPVATKVTLDMIKDVFSKDLIKFGDANKKVLFVEIGDPSCPFCHAASGANHTIFSALGGTSFKLVADGGSYVAPVTEMHKLVEAGKASFAYIYYPGHGSGEMAMKALYCAQEKGKFWEAHDLLMSDKGYELQNTTVKNDKAQSGKVADFLKSAVDATFLKSCLDSGKYDARLTSDQSLAVTLGVQGTPGFFVNESSYPGAYNWTDMKAAVETLLK